MRTSTELSNAYVEYSWRLRQLHALIRVGEGDSDKAEAIRDEMDDSYARLTEEEIDRLKLLSADLNSIGEGVTPGADRSSADEIYRRNITFSPQMDPVRLRDLLETNSTDPSWNAYIRFVYWSTSGELESARPFAQFVLACVSDDLADLTHHLDQERQEIDAGLSKVTESEIVEFRQRQEQLGGLISKINLLKSRVGSLYEPTIAERPIAPTDQNSHSLTEDDNQQLLSIFSSIRSISWAVRAA